MPQFPHPPPFSEKFEEIERQIDADVHHFYNTFETDEFDDNSLDVVWKLMQATLPYRKEVINEIITTKLLFYIHNC